MRHAKSSTLLILVSALAACAPRPTVVELVTEPVKEELYRVNGSSILDVIGSINSQLVGGFAAYAGVNIFYEMQTNSSLFGSCTLKSIKVTTRPYVKIPDWKSSGTFEASMLPNWLRYIEALRIHENGHIDIGVAGAANFAQKFSYPNVVKASNCTQLEQTVRAIYDAEIAKLNQENKDYDRITGHGKTQGTSFAWN